MIKKKKSNKVANELAQKETVKKETPKKNTALLKVVEDINKKFGEGAVTLGLPETMKNGIERIPTGSFCLDVDLGGGIPVGRIIEISGGFSSGKSTQVMHIIRNAQEKFGMMTAILDAEGTYTREYFELLNVNPQMCYYSEPDSLEEATQLILDLQKSGSIEFAVIDSIAALAANRVIESGMDESVQMGLAPKLWGEFLSKFQLNNNGLVRQGKRAVTLIGINQLREKIGAYGDPEYTTGGRAWGFYKSVDIRFRKGDWITVGKGDSKEVVGQVTKYKIEKNKTYKRMRTGEFDFYLSQNPLGVHELYNDNAKEVIILAIECDVIQKAGAWFKYKEEKYQGLDNLVKALMKNSSLMQELTETIKNLVIAP